MVFALLDNFPGVGQFLPGDSAFPTVAPSLSSSPKRILILTAGFGEGHNTAARGVRDALGRLAPETAEVRLLDPFDEYYGRLNQLVRRAYLTAINRTPRLWERVYRLIDSTQMVESNLPVLARMRRELSALLDDFRPDAVVSTYPVFNYLMDRTVSRHESPRAWRQITVVTDSISINSVWHRCHSDVFLVPNERTADVMRDAGVAPSKIHVTGFPVSPRFADPDILGMRGPAEQGRHQVLFMINSGKRQATELSRALAARPDVALTVTVGRDDALRRDVEAATGESTFPVRVIGWTDRMPELLAGSHLVITKAGGATVQEAIASRCPLILSQVVPGQEEGNARLVTESGCGVLAESVPAILDAVDGALTNGAARLTQWQDQIAAISRPDAALQVARFVLDDIESNEIVPS